MVGPRLERFYADLMHELDEHLHHGGTIEGFGMVVKRVGLAHGVECAVHTPLPRLSREARNALHWDGG